MKLRTNDIATSLTHNPLTTVKITNTQQANYVIDTATKHWLSSHPGQGWLIYHLTLAHNLTRTQELGLQYTNTVDYGRADDKTFWRFSHPDPYVLFIAETDPITPKYIYENVNALTAHPTSRILAIEWQTHLLL